MTELADTVADVARVPNVPVTQWTTDGVRFVWAESLDETSTAVVTFRVGVADETLATRGITHLVEHLALHGIEFSPHRNGQTELAVTRFFQEGTQDEVLAFLASLASQFEALPTDRIGVEKGILRAEERGRGGSLFDDLAAGRYGAGAHGLSWFRELGLGATTGDQVREWAARYFTAENAVVLLVTPTLPDEIDFRLPHGKTRPAPIPAHTLRHVPSYGTWDETGPGLILDVEIGSAPAAFAKLLERRLFAKMRQERGLCYRVDVSYTHVGARQAIIAASTDAVPDMSREATTAFIDVVYDLAAHGPSSAEIAAVVDEFRRMLQSRNPLLDAMVAADLLVYGYLSYTRADMLARLEHLDPEDVRRIAQTVKTHAFYLFPAEYEVGVPGAQQADLQPLQGDRYPGLGEVDGSAIPDLILGPDGMAEEYDGERSIVRFSHCAALLKWPDGRRQAIGRDGAVIDIEPQLHDIATPAMRALDAAVPTHLHIDMPQRQPHEIPQTAPAGSLRGRRL